MKPVIMLPKSLRFQAVSLKERHVKRRLPTSQRPLKVGLKSWNPNSRLIPPAWSRSPCNGRRPKALFRRRGSPKVSARRLDPLPHIKIYLKVVFVASSKIYSKCFRVLRLFYSDIYLTSSEKWLSYLPYNRFSSVDLCLAIPLGRAFLMAAWSISLFCSFVIFLFNSAGFSLA